MAFLNFPAYGGPATWRQLLDQSPPQPDAMGGLAPPWGDAIRAAVAFENQTPNWSSMPGFQDGPAGQVLSYLQEKGGGHLMQQGNTTEQAAHAGQLQMMGMPGGGMMMPPGGMMAPPPQFGMGGVPGGLPPHYATLSGVQKIEVKEKVNVIEALTAILGQEIEMANRYKIFNEDGQEELFYAVERTDCCTRQIKQCFPDCAPWNVDILHTRYGQNQLVFKLQRDCTMTCLCFNRPTVVVTDVTTNQKIGTLVDPFACCDLTFTINGPDDQPALKANGGCCQMGLCCPLPCGPCAEVSFPVTDAKSGQEVGMVQKQVPGCCKWLLAPDVQNYKVAFGGVSSPQYKALLMALTIFIDFRYFEDNSNDDNGGVLGQMQQSQQ